MRKPLKIGDKVTWTEGPNKGIHVRILSFHRGSMQGDPAIIPLSRVQDSKGNTAYFPVESLVRARKISGIPTVYCSYCGKRISAHRAAGYYMGDDIEGVNTLCAKCAKELEGTGYASGHSGLTEAAKRALLIAAGNRQTPGEIFAGNNSVWNESGRLEPDQVRVSAKTLEMMERAGLVTLRVLKAREVSSSRSYKRWSEKLSARGRPTTHIVQKKTPREVWAILTEAGWRAAGRE